MGQVLHQVILRNKPPITDESEDPNSFYWRKRALDITDTCRRLLGPKAWAGFVDEKWPGESEPLNWRELAEFAESVYGGIHAQA